MLMTRNGVTKEWKADDLAALLPRGWVPVESAKEEKAEVKPSKKTNKKDINNG
jgi:hypothetical protein